MGFFLSLLISILIKGIQILEKAKSYQQKITYKRFREHLKKSNI